MPPLQKSLWAVEFPQGRVDFSAVGPSGYDQGKLPVGESVTLYAIEPRCLALAPTRSARLRGG